MLSAMPAHMDSYCHRPKQSFLSGVVEALDFAEARSTNDAKLIYQAKQKKKGERLTPEEAK